MQDTIGEKVQNFLARKEIEKITCEKLRTLGSNKAFKIGFH